MLQLVADSEQHSDACVGQQTHLVLGVVEALDRDYNNNKASVCPNGKSHVAALTSPVSYNLSQQVYTLTALLVP